MQKLLSLAPNVAAAVSIIAAIVAAGSAVMGWTYGAGAHAERDRQMQAELALLKTRVDALAQPTSQAFADQCINLSKQVATDASVFAREQAREAMTELGCRSAQ